MFENFMMQEDANYRNDKHIRQVIDEWLSSNTVSDTMKNYHRTNFEHIETLYIIQCDSVATIKEFYSKDHVDFILQRLYSLSQDFLFSSFVRQATVTLFYFTWHCMIFEHVSTRLLALKSPEDLAYIVEGMLGKTMFNSVNTNLTAQEWVELTNRASRLEQDLKDLYKNASSCEKKFLDVLWN